METKHLIFLGIKGCAVALERATGRIVWEIHLKGSAYTQVVLDGDNLYATTQGEIFCLNPVNGEGRWSNKLKGYGLGLVSIAGAGIVANSGDLIAAEECKRAEEAQIVTASTMMTAS